MWFGQAPEVPQAPEAEPQKLPEIMTGKLAHEVDMGPK